MIPTDTPSIVEKSLRGLRTIFFLMFGAMMFYMGMGEFLTNGKKAETVDPSFVNIFLVLGLAEAVVLIGIRKKMVEPAVNALGQNPDNEEARRRWTQTSIVSFAIASSIALFGFVLRILGASLPQASMLYGTAVVMMFLSAPQRPQ